MLIDCVSAKRKIEFEGGSFEVRAVSLADVAGLIVNHQAAVDRISVIVRARQELNMDDAGAVIEILVDVIRESPYLAADLITSCAEEPAAYEAALKLPITVQIETLRAIGDLTFADGIALKKFVADVRVLLTGILPPTVVAEAA